VQAARDELVTIAPCCDECEWKEEAPGEEPDEMRKPVHEERHFVVVVGESAADEAEEVLVDEVEVPEAVDVSDGRVIADGMALIGIAQAAEDVPRSSYGEIEKDAGEGLEFAPAPPVSGEEEIRDRGACEENGSDESFGKSGKRKSCPHEVNATRSASLEGRQEGPQREEQKEAEQCFWNGEARKEEGADGSKDREASIKSRAGAPPAADPKPGNPGEAQYPKGIRQVGCKSILSEDLVESGCQPIGKRWLLKIANAVHLHGDPVA